MAPRTEEEKARRRAEYEARKAARLAAKQKEQEEKKNVTENEIVGVNQNTAGICEPRKCYFLTLSDDTQNQVFSYLDAKELGSISMTCRDVNFSMEECSVVHLLSRLNTIKGTSGVGKLAIPIKLCDNKSEARRILTLAVDGSEETGRLITKKSRQGKKKGAGDADEYIAYARFLEEAVQGHALQRFPRENQSVMPSVVNGRFASASPEHSLCRVGGDGTKSGAGGSGVASWGVGTKGQLGHGKRKNEQKPKMLVGGIGYGTRCVQVSAGGGLVRVAHSLLLTSTGRVYSFGTAGSGQLGHGYSPGKQLPDLLRPRMIRGLAHLNCTCVSAGELHSAVVTSDGDLYVFGDGFCGQLGIGDKRPQLLPVQVEKGGLEDEIVMSVSCGARHTLAITEDGDVYSFGLGHFGVLGRSYTPYEYFNNAAVSGLGVDIDIDAQNDAGPLNHIHQINDDMRHHLDLLANLTLDDSSDQCIPKVIEALQGIKIIGASAGHRHSLFLDAYGGVYSCGDGSGGALGHGNLEKQDIPMKIMYFDMNNIQIMQISAGVDTSMAVSTTGEVYAWGFTKNGRIGVKTEDDYVSTPHRVFITNPTGEEVKAVDVECGYQHSLVIGIDGTVHYCGNIDVDSEESESLVEGSESRPCQIPNFNIWHRIPEPQEEVVQTKWKKYGKYELKGRSAMMAESNKWNI
jgi:alpha-tubulin suppressor-like RCC1 family protein